MLLRGLEFKTKPRKAVSFVMMLTMLISLLWIANPGTASMVGVPADSLTIKVGYFGGHYYTKKIFSVSDLEAMPQVEQAYTLIDNMPAVVIDSAKGVKLTDLLVSAGIDVNSVQSFYFYATDIKNGWYVCLPKSYLLDTPRYYYPNLPTHWVSDKQPTIPGAVYGAIQAPTIIAIQDNWQRFATSPDFSVQDTSTRFRLLFGQTDTSTQTAMRSAKWVHVIEVMLGGTPPSGVTLDQNIANLKVGSTVQLTATVAPDDATDKSVTWSSSDTSVARVDNNGLVTVVGPGTATITVVSTVFGNMAASCIVNGPNQVGGDRGAVPAETPLPGTDKQYLTEKEVASKQSGHQPWRVFEMSADAIPLQMQREQNSLDTYAAVIFLVLFLLGAGRRYSEYVKEI